MTFAEPTAQSRIWPRLSWWGAVAVAMALQVGFILALGSRSEKTTEAPLLSPAIQLDVTRPGESLPLRDPTLFILPHREGFSGRAWLQVPPLVVQAYAWTVPDQWLGLPTESLGTVFNDFMRTNNFVTTRFDAFPEPQVSDPGVPPPAPLELNSTLEIKGDLAARAVVSQPDLPAQPGADLVANSSVQVLVDAKGDVLSTILLPFGSSPTDADRHALELAKSVRFAPLTQSGGPAAVTLGTIVFEWQTIPVTNTVPNP